MELIDKLTIDDLEPEQKQLAQLLGVEKYIELIKIYGGSSLYISKADTLSRNIRDKQIREEFNGNYRELATKYRMSERYIRGIVYKDNYEN